ncbi:hypothetical protein AFB00_14020 [Pseudonocardia sp. HH130630-07]|nr:YdcF family protein [Pseudonocardia sp. HH130630-07]ANY10060.1 hypothetical protein AFB00_14020 [Pseudonocardia sp. HH130630-07]
MSDTVTVTPHDRDDAQRLWHYHQMGHDVRAADVAIGLGSHDLGVASYAAQLYLQGHVPLIVFTGATSATTKDRFPRGEAIHYRERAVELGVPHSSILVEPEATNTGANISLTREVLTAAGFRPRSALLVCKPYMQRRAFATAEKVWPDLGVRCVSAPLSFDAYSADIGDDRLVVDMLVGDLQRVLDYPAQGFATPQHVPTDVEQAYARLVERGFTRRLV